MGYAYEELTHDAENHRSDCNTKIDLCLEAGFTTHIGIFQCFQAIYDAI